jgi:hypothetical protein
MYLDLIYRLIQFLNSRYLEPTNRNKKSEFRYLSIQRWTVDYITIRMLDNPDTNPLDIIDDAIMEYEACHGASKLPENKLTYSVGVSVLDSLRMKADYYLNK